MRRHYAKPRWVSAVSAASDVPKSAAGMVLTEPGLAGIVAAVKEGRITFQRILSYTLNSITKKVASRAGESHPHALPEPYVTLSSHTAPDVRPFACRKRQWAKR